MTDLPPLHRWDAVAQPRGLVHVVHGMSEHGGRYARLAAALNRAGYAVWAHDHRGHGLNPTPPVGLGHFADTDGWRAVVDDTRAVSTALQASHPNLPVFLFAHSMGSFVGQALIGEHGEREGRPPLRVYAKQVRMGDVIDFVLERLGVSRHKLTIGPLGCDSTEN